MASNVNQYLKKPKEADIPVCPKEISEAEIDEEQMKVFVAELAPLITSMKEEVESMMIYMSHMQRILLKEEKKARDGKDGWEYQYSLKRQLDFLEEKHQEYIKHYENVFPKLDDKRICAELKDAVRED